MIKTTKPTAVLIIALVLIGGINFSCKAVKNGVKKDDSPRIINIVNFIRQTDYRVENSDSLLFDVVQKQIELVNKYGFPATFLFQYDALINPDYQQLMKTQLKPDCEIGAWWEITQPHVEAAGIKWRGDHSWVSTANIAFTTGYTPEERENLVDVYMARFKEIYGYYPQSVGSWYIDAHTLAYMYDKYGIVASCNCKDQVGTDGYTLWGGYWNQAYYPSRKNAYMPAQSESGQIPVPIFRMLGSDPIYQYDTGVGTNSQHVISLEPVYAESGRDKRWVEYFLDAIVNQPCLAFNYAQAGQENSFTWTAMKEGLEMQFPIFDSLSKAGRIEVQTLKQSGLWFKEQFSVTPATAVTTLKDFRGEGNKTVWFNSRYYRANLYWEKDGFRFRDIHLFDERFVSDYLETPGVGGQFFYFTLPVVDGYFWSTDPQRAGLRIMQISANGDKTEVVLGEPVVTEPSKGELQVECKDRKGNGFVIVMKEDKIEVQCKASEKDFRWAMELKAATERLDRLPFESLGESEITAVFNDFKYSVTVEEGTVSAGKGDDYVFRLLPANDRLVINCKSN